MSRLTFVSFALYLLVICSHRYSLAQDLSQIKPTIEKERQIVRIRNKILKELVNNGAKISRFDAMNSIETSKGEEIVNKQEIQTNVQTDINVGNDDNSRSKALVTLGEPVSEARDKCLVFSIRKYVKNVEYINPKKIDLWIHIRKRDSKKNKKKNSKLDRMLRDGTDENKKIDDKASNDRKKGRRKNKRKKHGRRIKIFITDGAKTLVKMRMRIRKTKWYKIELPISQFPDVISVNDSFKLCFKCKRCSKKIKMDLYRRGVRELNEPDVAEQTPQQPTIPFIHFEEHRSQNTFRYRRSSDVKRSNDVKINRHRHHHLTRSRSSQKSETCCREEIYIEEISSLFPSILYPESVNISFCTGNSDFYEHQPLLSQTSTSQTSMNIACEPMSYKRFTFVYVNNNFKVKHASIPDLIPVGCSCRTTT